MKTDLDHDLAPLISPAVVLASPIIRDYMINFAKNVMFSTSMPYTDIYALEACLSVIASARGQKVRFIAPICIRAPRSRPASIPLVVIASR